MECLCTLQCMPLWFFSCCNVHFEKTTQQDLCQHCWCVPLVEKQTINPIQSWLTTDLLKAYGAIGRMDLYMHLWFSTYPGCSQSFCDLPGYNLIYLILSKHHLIIFFQSLNILRLIDALLSLVLQAYVIFIFGSSLKGSF